MSTARHNNPSASRPSGPELTVVDLFAGAGGISQGFQNAGFRVLGGLDIDPDAVATYATNFKGAQSVCGDIRTREVRERVLEMASKADVIAGGPPCQAFSQVRNHARLIDDPRNSLYREFVRVVGVAKPKAFLMENVTGMDQMGVRSQIAHDLELEGEYVVHSQVVDAANFGVPQTRKRLLFIGVHRSLHCAPPVLAGTDATSALFLERSKSKRMPYRLTLSDDLWADKIAKCLADPSDLSVISVEKAISDLAGLKTGNREDELDYSLLGPPVTAYQRLMRSGNGKVLSNVQVPRINPDTRIRLAKIPQGGNHRDLPESLLGRYLTGQKWGQSNGSGRLSRRHFYAYRRLHPSIWAWTLNTKADSVYHYSTCRALSVREFARIQSFPDSFVITTDPNRGMIRGRIDGGPAHSRYRQIGNAVPPLLAEAVASKLKDILVTRIASKRRTA